MKRRIENIKYESHTDNYGSGVLTKKRDRYKWREIGERGVFMLINKNDLEIDLNYQRRGTSKGRFLKIAREFDWGIFGCLTVSETKDGRFFVLDGGHRLRASMLRDDIFDLPCMVFKGETISREAELFYGLNTSHKAVSAYDKYKAALVAGKKEAILARDTIGVYGYEFTKSSPGQFQTQAVSTVMRMVLKDIETCDKAICFASEVACGMPITKDEIESYFHLISVNRDIDFFKLPLKKAKEYGQSSILASIRQQKIRENAGGYLVASRGVASLLNKRSRIKIKVER